MLINILRPLFWRFWRGIDAGGGMMGFSEEV